MRCPIFFLMLPPPPRSTLFPYTTLFRSFVAVCGVWLVRWWNLRAIVRAARPGDIAAPIDRKSTRLNSSHPSISYAVFCLKKKRHSCVLSGLEVFWPKRQHHLHDMSFGYF